MGEVIKMTQKEISRVEILERLKKGEINQGHASQSLGLSRRQSQRLKKRYNEKGVAGITHAGRGKKSNRRIKESEIADVLEIVRERYQGFGPTLAYEKLKETGRMPFGLEVLRRSMIAQGLWKSKSRKQRRMHYVRERRPCFGELIQIDGSLHKWFEERGPMCTLLAYIDDATSSVVHAEFVKSESTWSYFGATERYFRRHGKPLALYTDKNSTFRVNVSKEGQSATRDSHGDTQFSRALKSLDVGIIYAQTPQAKGRVERLYQTLQDRLVKELRLANISSLEDGNLFLERYLADHNARFAVDPKDPTNLHRPLAADEDLTRVFLLQETRVLSKTLTCQYKNKAYQIYTEKATYRMTGAQVTVHENRLGEVFFEYNGQPLKHSVLDIKPLNKDSDSKTLNTIVDEIKTSRQHREASKTVSVHKPAPNHPWRRYPSTVEKEPAFQVA